MNIKINVIKLDKCIIYKPEEISTEFYNQAKRINNVCFGNFHIHFFGTPELTGSSIYLGLSHCKSGSVCHRIFSNNEQRDKYYNDMMSSIKQSIDYLKMSL